MKTDAFQDLLSGNFNRECKMQIDKARTIRDEDLSQYGHIKEEWLDAVVTFWYISIIIRNAVILIDRTKNALKQKGIDPEKTGEGVLGQLEKVKELSKRFSNAIAKHGIDVSMLQANGLEDLINKMKPVELFTKEMK